MAEPDIRPALSEHKERVGTWLEMRPKRQERPGTPGLRNLTEDVLISYPTGNRQHLKGFQQRKDRHVDKMRLTF